jgi:AbiU2
LADQTAEQFRKANIEKMGEDLGALYSALWQAVATIHVYWKDYVELFGTKQERIELLNQAAPAFFRMLQGELWEMSLLHIARLTDPSYTFKKSEKANLTIKALPVLIIGTKLKEEVTRLVEAAMKATEFCRDWRNRHIAHRDLKLALEQTTEPLAPASREQVTAALKALAAVLNAIGMHYLKSETGFELTPRHNGAATLLYVLDDGMRLREDQQRQLLNGSSPCAAERGVVSFPAPRGG